MAKRNPFNSDMVTLILATGSSYFTRPGQTASASHYLRLFNCRPALSWVILDVLKKTEDYITVIVEEKAKELIQFCLFTYGRNPRFTLCKIHQSANLVKALSTALQLSCSTEHPSCVRVICGYTYILHHTYRTGDYVYLSEFKADSRYRYRAKPGTDCNLKVILNSMSGICSSEDLSVLGRFEFSDGDLLQKVLKNSLERNNVEFGPLLKEYSQERLLHGKEIENDRWIDFRDRGKISRGQSKLIESRSFNELTIHPGSSKITKSSHHSHKIRNELYWYQYLPRNLHCLVPTIVDFTHNSISMEYCGCGTLAEKLVYHKINESSWKEVLRQLFDILSTFKKQTDDTQKINPKQLYIRKTSSRIQELERSSKEWENLVKKKKIIINKKEYFGLSSIKEKINSMSFDICNRFDLSIMHGDFCFNNILYDTRTGIIKLIDPRGSYDGMNPSIYGDSRYDVAKLRHSFCGNYDYIIEGNFYIKNTNHEEFTLEIYSRKQKKRNALFDELCREYEYCIEDIKFIEALIFLTLVPLHDDSKAKQLAFFLLAILKFNSLFFKAS